MIVSKKRILERLRLKRRILESTRMLEAKSDPDYLAFVIKWFSDDENNWLDEWEYIGCYRQPAQCICGKEGLATVFIIRNKINKMVLSPIGSVCIRKFIDKMKIPQAILDNLRSGLLGYLNRNTIFFKRNIAITTEFFSKENMYIFFNHNLIDEEELELCLKALNKRYATVDEYQKGTSIIINKIIMPIKNSLNKEIEQSTVPSNSIYFTQEMRLLMDAIYNNVYKTNKFTVKETRALVAKVFPSNMLLAR